MSTLKEKIVLEINGLCRNRACAELAADIAIKNMVALKPSHNNKRDEICPVCDCVCSLELITVCSNCSESVSIWSGKHSPVL